MNKELFGSLFKVGDIINSGGPSDRANSAQLEILAIEDDLIRYKSVKSQTRIKLRYSDLDVVLEGFSRIDPEAIQRTIQRVYLDAGRKENLWTENYEYGFAREIRRRLEKCASRLA